jgi:hypothetical protein
LQHIVQGRFVAVEIGDQNFNLAGRVEFANFSDRLGPVHRTAVGEVVAIDRGDNGVFEIKMLYGLGHVCRLHRVKVHRLALIHRAKAAVPRARIAAEHERRSLVRPAFENVRALRFLADGMQIQPVDQLHHLILIARVAKLDLQPIRLSKLRTLLPVEELLYEDLLFDHK